MSPPLFQFIPDLRGDPSDQPVRGSIAVLTSGGDCQGMNSVLYGLACRHLAQLRRQQQEQEQQQEKERQQEKEQQQPKSKQQKQPKSQSESESQSKSKSKSKSKSRYNNNTNKQQKNNNELYLIRNGFQGLCDGTSESIMACDIEMLQQHLYMGGTVIGSSRCKEFYQREGRKKAALNLLKRDIQNLVVIGGDGSLTGANLLRREWTQFIREFIRNGNIHERYSQSQLNLVGIIGSIDNDFYGSDMTVGADSALFRVVESIDALKTTAKSHSRLIVCEVMGRNCGYLAISSALSTAASFVFIPEAPQKTSDDWQHNLMTRVRYERENGQYHHIILVAEGACDENGRPIKSVDIRDYLKDSDVESRVVILGHLQRGGFTSAFDQLMSMQMGIESYNVLAKNLNMAVILCINQDVINTKSLVNCINELAKLSKYVKERNWTKVMEQRGVNFKNTWENYNRLMALPPPLTPSSASDLLTAFDSSSMEAKAKTSKKRPTTTSIKPPPIKLPVRWAIVMCGDPVPGINGIVYALVRYGFAHNIRVLGYQNGLEGLIKNDYKMFEWGQVAGYIETGGCVLGCQSRRGGPTPMKITDQTIGKVMDNLKENNVKFICFVGNQLAFDAIKMLHKYRPKYHQLVNSKYCLVPVSPIQTKDLPWSRLGRDSMMNKTLRIIRDLISSTRGTYNRIYLIRLNLSILATMFANPGVFALACGATIVYPANRNDLLRPDIDMKMVQEHSIDLREMILQNNENKFILVHFPFWEKILSLYQTSFENFKTQIKLSPIDLCELQFPTLATPYDRKLGVKLGMECGRYFSDENFETTPIVINTPFLYEAKLVKSTSKSPQSGTFSLTKTTSNPRLLLKLTIKNSK